MKKAKIILLVCVVIIIIFGFVLSQQSSEKNTSNENKFKEVTNAYEVLMNEYDDKEFQDQKQKIQNYITASSQFTNLQQNSLLEESYYNFGEIYKVENTSDKVLTTPHLTASTNLYQCISNNTDDILKIIPIIETDNKMAKSLMYYVDDFCKLPTNCNLDKNDLYLKFVGIIHRKDYGVWYYYLTDEDGSPKLNNSWVSLHCSYQNGLCALTGVFFNSKECSPEGVINSENDYSYIPLNDLELK
ncbi:MAG: hypothetical protein A2249_00360 [Candidatus Jacksonbacteria bacterium RIFOXYA2_FULL_44_7]|uniref:Uncharacterized protein n=1 Tax=Candidatus Jacksonbacteria bacterium RIFCSPLOWO2_02_FULL_44_20 TaxID=1798460 RepID=A0A1G2A5X7_9BACT|nr:MAG: hypothetical protein UW39_C0008G0044 [Parcubacteria group bacterium GW2011_GWC2_44_17]KKT50490.1 MAG: hypothetical protein UW40_C0003G0013 [Parcubacteria group bacterium GW2011_GWF2_44_17]OGY71421.1 MAG: hypothetical protein A3C00_03995 [Candidatus Jacksonbacteria bacterium RIFCSPHIGHO2_02_FULL_44_25]OGY72184.1 MAG: hypothetical protein A3E05_01300 [Candidatus Jacksonbacteria bacterium RIFCSPHIGHO2_12_FULL_44_12]OGY72303.1 MAG: hypothetical protein A3H61_00785 [Candidatus Jacksonbacteri